MSCFRDPLIVFGNSDETDRLLEKKLLNELRSHPPPTIKGYEQKEKIPSLNKHTGVDDTQLMTSILARITQLEEQLKVKNQLLIEKVCLKD